MKTIILMGTEKVSNLQFKIEKVLKKQKHVLGSSS